MLGRNKTLSESSYNYCKQVLIVGNLCNVIAQRFAEMMKGNNMDVNNGGEINTGKLMRE